ncbi:hypothetical protein APX70_00314, partial [Pseudomonas syringae pv. maculicola]
AKAMQRALLLKRQQQAFIEIEPEESTDDLPTDSDLAFISYSSEHLTTLENPAAPTNKALTETVDDSLTFIQHTASQYPSLKTNVWWEGQFESTPSEASTCLDELEARNEPDTAPATTDDFSGEHVTEDEDTSPSATNTVLKLAHPRKETEAGEGLAKVKIFNKSGRSLISVQPKGLGAPEPSDSHESPLQPTTLPAPEVPALTSQTHDEVSEENDEDDEYLALTDLELNTPTLPQLNF